MSVCFFSMSTERSSWIPHRSRLGVEAQKTRARASNDPCDVDAEPHSDRPSLPRTPPATKGPPQYRCDDAVLPRAARALEVYDQPQQPDLIDPSAYDDSVVEDIIRKDGVPDLQCTAVTSMAEMSATSSADSHVETSAPG